jgi:lipooligosaccharide transport system permease protein
VFFPVTRLPDALEIVTWATPLFHGVELVRGLTLDTFESPVWLAHVAYLAVMMCAGVLAGRRTFRRSLHP